MDEALKLSLSKLVTIVGHGAEEVKKQLGDKSEYALQAEQLKLDEGLYKASISFSFLVQPLKQLQTAYPFIGLQYPFYP